MNATIEQLKKDKKAEQKKFIGNAVEVNVATALVEATAHGVKTIKIAA